MTIEISDYLHLAYSSLPLAISDVERDVKSKGGRDKIYEAIGPIFREHQVDEKFGVGLLHRHFDMAPDERLVEINNISMPWDLHAIAEVGGGICPASWLFYEGKLVPYEYTFTGSDTERAEMYTNPADYPAFLEALYARLKELGLQNALALRVHPGPDFKGSVEFTVGRANISVSPSTVSIDHTVEVIFFFDPGYNARGYAKKCQAGKCH